MLPPTYYFSPKNVVYYTHKIYAQGFINTKISFDKEYNISHQYHSAIIQTLNQQNIHFTVKYPSFSKSTNMFSTQVRISTWVENIPWET